MKRHEILERWQSLTTRERAEWAHSVVMGERLFTQNEMCAIAEQVWKEQPNCMVFADGFYCSKRVYGGKSEFTQQIPPYPEKIAAAELVVERMRERYGTDGHNGFMVSQRGGEPWYCEFSQPRWECAEADTMPEAVCLAALLTTAED